MIGKLIIPVSQHVLMNDEAMPNVDMSIHAREDPLDCSESWKGEHRMRYEVLSLSWWLGLEVSIIPGMAR